MLGRRPHVRSPPFTLPSVPHLPNSIRPTPYRMELLSPVPPYHRRALRQRTFERGDLVFYGPMPNYYGIGEVKRIEGPYVSVDFRGTGSCGIHEDTLEKQYLIPLSTAEIQMI